MDLVEYKSIIEIHQQQMTSCLNTLESFENRFESKIKQAKIYPTWAVVVFIIVVLCQSAFAGECVNKHEKDFHSYHPVFTQL